MANGYRSTMNFEKLAKSRLKVHDNFGFGSSLFSNGVATFDVK